MSVDRPAGEVNESQPGKESIEGQPAAAGDQLVALKGGVLRIVENMDASLSVPSATSYRTIPVKLLEENRRIINEHQKEHNLNRVSYTHIIAWSLVRALREFPALNSSYEPVDGAPHRRMKKAINLGVAVDLERKDGSHMLLVPNIKDAGALSFPSFVQAYDQTIEESRKGTIDPADFQGTSVTLTNPGTVGTYMSLPRLMAGQGAIIATGAIGYPTEYHAWSPRALSSLGLSQIMTVSCTYDHRIIQGAETGAFLGRVKELLMGQDGFYEQIFNDLKVPSFPMHWALDQAPASFAAVPQHADSEKQVGVLQLINLYRVRGHLIAHLDPLGDHALYHTELDPSTFGLTLWDLDREFVTGGLGGLEKGTLRQILEILRQTYCQTVGIEYRHIQDANEKNWILERIEPPETRAPLDPETRKLALRRLIEAEGFERYLHTRFIGHKRFGLEGAETMIPVLAKVLAEAANAGVAEAVIGMAHRGRLNVLANIIGKALPKILSEFEENTDPMITQGSGDVKYHLGSAGPFRSNEGNEIYVSVISNPSHLEWVNPVVEGVARAKQARRGDEQREQVIPVLIHGDGAFAGQGVVWETINLSQLRGYRTGGTVHIIINNQIGFTTMPEGARSSQYATDLARSVQAPIFHVNGDDPDAAIRISRLAFEYRQAFKKDVVVDVYCYRRHGHNEGDEPSYTQPLLYRKISERPSVVTLYADKLIRESVVTRAEVDALHADMRARLDAAYEVSKRGNQHFEPDLPLAVTEEELREFQPTGGTNVGMEMLLEVARGLTTLPGGFQLHPKLAPFFERRRALLSGEAEIDWAYAEALAFGTLVYEGTPVRLSGQDCARGTFSQRHLVLRDLETSEEHVPLRHIHPEQARFEVFDSSLSEAGVLGFEFGYSVADPLTLVLWEAQFGDFANTAQVIIDNFIASSEVKWQQPCDLVLLLPHGYEGQGPEHSSARLERYLSLCAADNIRVCIPTTAAQYFHLLRRQVRDAKRIPLVVLTPKSTLRHPGTMSAPHEVADGAFELVLDDAGAKDKDAVRRILACSGKVYFDLQAEQEKRRNPEIAVVRIEQLYPFPEWNVSNVLGSYAHAREVVWVQEEPQNQGAWNFVRQRIADSLPFGRVIRYVGRPESPNTATGSLKAHRREQAALVSAAFS